MVNVKCMSSLFEQTLVFGFDKNGFYCTGSIHIHAHTAHTHTSRNKQVFFTFCMLLCPTRPLQWLHDLSVKRPFTVTRLISIVVAHKWDWGF